MSYRLAKSLETLRRQVNERWPGRDKTSDGWIGDRAHRNRPSDHNPNSLGVVTALDIDKDLSASEKVELVVNALVTSRDPRIKYVIWRGRILSSLVQPWAWRKYTVANGHFEHVHISVMADPRLYDDPREWNLGGQAVSPPEPEAGEQYTVSPGDTLWKIAERYGRTTAELRAMNPTITNPDLIRPGDKIRVR